jgi:hypothetical protein
MLFWEVLRGKKKNNSTIFGLEKAGSLQEKSENRRGSVFV